MEKNTFLEGQWHEAAFVQPLREQRLFAEFSHFLFHFVECKRFVENRNELDAYSSLIRSLHHWAAMEIIEQDLEPETALWLQMRKINPGIYKLYEELTESKETVILRIQLLMLACEFTIMSKIQRGSKFLLDLICSRNNPWSMSELAQHSLLEDVKAELPLVVQKLVKKSLLKEVLEVVEDLTIVDMRYKAVI